MNLLPDLPPTPEALDLWLATVCTFWAVAIVATLWAFNNWLLRSKEHK
jgi:hypothetical protein